MRGENIIQSMLEKILAEEPHHGHAVVHLGENKTLCWDQNNEVVAMCEKIGLNNVMALFSAMGLDKNSEIVRKFYRDIGSSIFGYWEVFYWEVNNPDADEYKAPTS